MSGVLTRPPQATKRGIFADRITVTQLGSINARTRVDIPFCRSVCRYANTNSWKTPITKTASIWAASFYAAEKERKMRKSILFLASLLALLIMLEVSSPVYAQEAVGGITGVVQDSSGAAVPGASVMAMATATGVSTEV